MGQEEMVLHRFLVVSCADAWGLGSAQARARMVRKRRVVDGCVSGDAPYGSLSRLMWVHLRIRDSRPRPRSNAGFA